MNKINLVKLRENFEYVNEKSINYVMIDLASKLINLFEEPKYNNDNQEYYLSHIDLIIYTPAKKSDSSFELVLVYSHQGNPKLTLTLKKENTFEACMEMNLITLHPIPTIHYEMLENIYNNYILPDETGLNNTVAKYITQNITPDIMCSFKDYKTKISQIVNEKWVSILEKEQLEKNVDEKVGKATPKQKI